MRACAVAWLVCADVLFAVAVSLVCDALTDAGGAAGLGYLMAVLALCWRLYRYWKLLLAAGMASAVSTPHQRAALSPDVCSAALQPVGAIAVASALLASVTALAALMPGALCSVIGSVRYTLMVAAWFTAAASHAMVYAWFARQQHLASLDPFAPRNDDIVSRHVASVSRPRRRGQQRRATPSPPPPSAPEIIYERVPADDSLVDVSLRTSASDRSSSPSPPPKPPRRPPNVQHDDDDSSSESSGQSESVFGGASAAQRLAYLAAIKQARQTKASEQV